MVNDSVRKPKLSALADGSIPNVCKEEWYPGKPSLLMFYLTNKPIPPSREIFLQPLSAVPKFHTLNTGKNLNEVWSVGRMGDCN